MAFASLFFGIMSGVFSASASSGFAANIRDAMYTNIQTFSFSNIDKFSTAGLVTRMTTDVTNLQMAFMMIIRIAVRAPLMMIISLIMCITINPGISAIFLFALAVLGCALFFIIGRATSAFRKTFLERGGSEEQMVLYMMFRGAQPDPGALLRARGLE
jgi:ATP-binding cassette subfamily B protein